ncbi:MAG: thioesterase superfamily protein [Gemmatimonadetes bacterium]|jgi:YbgC/YbaW family acyl-CoA thioester hydrolase|nr:thioesterase superfamily protein [Gemmatimonadota bacterium]
MPAKTPFVTTEHVRWEDIDLAGIARYGSYTRFLDVAETDLYRSLGTPLSVLHAQYKVWLPRKVMHIDYFSPARLDDEITLAAYFSNIGRTSVTFNVDLLRDDRKTLIAAAHLVLVCVNVALEKIALPPEFRTLVDRYVMSSEEARAAL